MNAVAPRRPPRLAARARRPGRGLSIAGWVVLAVVALAACATFDEPPVLPGTPPTVDVTSHFSPDYTHLVGGTITFQTLQGTYNGSCKNPSVAGNYASGTEWYAPIGGYASVPKDWSGATMTGKLLDLVKNASSSCQLTVQALSYTCASCGGTSYTLQPSSTVTLTTTFAGSAVTFTPPALSGGQNQDGDPFYANFYISAAAPWTSNPTIYVLVSNDPSLAVTGSVTASITSYNGSTSTTYVAPPDYAVNIGSTTAAVTAGYTALSRTSWVVSASATAVGGSPASALAWAIDGSLTTRWSTGAFQAVGQWFEVNLGSVQSFNQITMNCTTSPTDYIRGYTVSVSNDGVSWGSAVFTGTGTNYLVTAIFPQQTAQYIRVTSTANSSANWWSIDEFNVYSAANVAATVSGGIALTYGSTPASSSAGCVYTTTAPTQTNAGIAAAFAAGTACPTTGDQSWASPFHTMFIDASNFVSVGNTVPATGYIILQNTSSGVSSYEEISYTFTSTCSTGETSKTDSSGMGAANACCASASTTLNCDGVCANTLVDANNCGSCGNACSAATPHCSAGSCVASCTTSSTLCSGVCVDTNTDDANCGGCANACSAGSYCSSGQCSYSCNGSAYTLSTSVANGTYALESYAGFYLDDYSAGGAGTGLDQWAFTGSNQEWTVTLVSVGQYKILAQNGLALTLGSGTGVQLTLQTYTGATTQLWGFTTNGSYTNIVNIGSCLAMDDESGGTILPTAVDATTFSNQTNTNQSWTLTLASSIAAPLANGTYQFLDSAGYSLDDSSGGGAGTTVGQWIYAGSNQQWTVTLVSGVQYKIIGDGGAALTATTGNGHIANLAAYTGASNQLWVFVPNGSTYNVINVGSYLALDDGSGGNGVQCNQWSWYNGGMYAANQQWSIGAVPTACSDISVTTNTYSSGIGHITWKNTGTIAEVNPQLYFYVPSGATLNTSTCAFSDQTAPGCSAVGCLQPGGSTQFDYTFVGSLAAGASISVEYSTQNSSEAVATSISVTANSCQ